jgi:hypothetical protein
MSNGVSVWKRNSRTVSVDAKRLVGKTISQILDTEYNREVLEK